MTEQGMRAASDHPARTVLEQHIWQRGMTLEGFARFAEEFAREHGEAGTLSHRHLKRLASGRGDGGKPLGRPQHATARLLERIFGVSIDELLSTPNQVHPDTESQLRERIRTSARIDKDVLDLLQVQLNTTRRLDRQLGATVAHDEVVTKIRQLTQLLEYSLMPSNRERLAGLLSELCALAGWQALDVGRTRDSWLYYERGKIAGNEQHDSAFKSLSAAGHSFVLVDIGDTKTATELLTETTQRVDTSSSRLTRAWFSAALGEVLAAAGRRSASLRAFDRADSLLPADASDVDGPYVALDAVHLARWRGHALARVGEPEAVAVLTSALDRLDPTFTRAEAALHVDLATAFAATGERERAGFHASRADALAADIGSTRQQRRIQQVRSERRSGSLRDEFHA